MAKQVAVEKEIKTAENRMKQNIEDWSETKKLASQAEKAAQELEETLETLAKRALSFHELLKKAYSSAPLTDSGYGYSPISQGVINFAMKRHLIKNGLRLDNTMIIEPEKALGFSQHVKDSLKWLLKFSVK